MKNVFDYDDALSGQGFRVQEFRGKAGIGTHIDAPAHCFPKRQTVDEIPLDKLIIPLVCIDVSSRSHESYQVTPHDILSFEEQWGDLSAGSFVAFNTGWSRFWDNPEKYRNNYVFPTLRPGVADLLLKREIAGIGIDTLSPDLPDGGFPIHSTLLCPPISS